MTLVKIFISIVLILVSYALAYALPELGVFFGWVSAIVAFCVCIFLPASGRYIP